MRLTGALDTLLDRAIVPGYSRIGYLARRNWWPADAVDGTLAGRTVAVTGANSGLGAATVAGLTQLGASVRMLCRDTTRGEDARRTVLAEVPDADVVVEECDLSDQKSVRAVASRLRHEVPALRGLVHNAGVLPPERTETDDGHELTLATHVLGPHLLTAELRPLLAADTDPRVVFVSSGGMYTQPLRIDDPEYRQGDYNGTKAYARTKRMQVVLAQLWAARLAGLGVSVHAMHPGWADTPGVTDSLPGFAKVVGPILRTPAEGADTAVWLVGADEPGRCSGLFWQDRRPRPTNYLPFTASSEADDERLWDYCADATGLA